MKRKHGFAAVGVAGLAIFLLLLISGQLSIAEVSADASQESPADSLYREVVNDSFGPGERLLFSIGYGFVTAGQATLAVDDTNTVDGHLCYRISSETTSNSFFDNFYKVRDTIISQIDVDGLYSRYFEKSLNEGSYQSRREIVFDHRKRRALYHKQGNPVDTIAIEPFAQDILSAMYYVRTLPLEVGKSVLVETVSGGKSSMLEVRVLKRETIDVPAGEFRCLVLEPMMSATGVFKAEGQIKVWVTDDRLRMPVLMKSKVVVGSIHAELEEFRLGDLNW